MVNDREFLRYSEGVFKPYFEKFIEHKRSKGEKVRHAALERMKRLNDALNKTGELHVTKETVERILAPEEGVSETTRYYMASFLRQFLNFMNAIGIECYRVPDGYVGSLRSEFRPYIFPDREIEALLKEADNLPDWKHSQRRRDIYPVLFRMLAGTGMRVGEALNLKPNDVDIDNGVVNVLNGKNGICRYVPMSESLSLVVRSYWLAHSEDDWLFTSPQTGSRYSYDTINSMFKKLCVKASIRRPNGTPPNLHSLRHTFCTKSLEQLLATGMDIYTAVPILSSYVGHVNFRDTERYIHFTEIDYNAFQERQKSLRRIIPEVSDDE